MTSLILRNQNQTPSIFGSFFDGVPRGSIFESFFDDVFRTPTLREFSQNSPVKVHVDKTDEAYDVAIAAPGISKDEVDVTVKENVLTVSHEHGEEEDNNYFCTSFTKSWTLPNDANVDKITAEYQDGIFKVSIPRVQPVEPEVKKIKVK
jgi:HSP20 family protein